MNNVWVVGKFLSVADDGVVWEFQGVFDSEEKADSACKNSNYFLAPAKLNEAAPDESTEWPGARYPRAE